MKVKELTLLILVFIVCVDLCLLYNEVDLDIWARMAVGKIFFELDHVSPQDIFAYTPTKPLWVDHEWGSGVIFYAVADDFGQKGLIVLRAFLYFFTIFFLHMAVKQRIENPNSLLLHIMLAYALLFGFWVTIRSHTFTYCLFALWVYLLERARNGQNRGLVFIPVTMILWANVHGGFVAGLGLLFMYGAGEFLNKKPWVKYLLLFIPCVLVTILNPYGLDYWIYLAKALTMPRPTIVEWHPFNLLGPLTDLSGLKLLFLLPILLFIINRVRRIKIDWVDVFLLLITGYLALKHIRHITFYFIAGFPFVYSSLRSLWDLLLEKRIFAYQRVRFTQAQGVGNIIRGIFHGVLMAIALLVVFSLPFQATIPASLLPVKGIAFIQKNHLQGNLLIPFSWGSYGLWELYPQCKVSVDGRYEEAYPETTYLDIHRFVTGAKGWEETLRKFAHDMILVDRNSPVTLKLKELAEWEVVYEDDLCVLFLPRGHGQREWILPDADDLEGDPFSTKGRPLFFPG